MALIYKAINPVVKTILKSPIHRVLSNNTLLLSFVGRKSGSPYEIPISYARDGDQFLCFTAKENQWWRNLKGDVVTQLLVAGDRIDVTNRLDEAQYKDMVDDLTLFLTQVPRDAKPAGVRLDKSGVPYVADLTTAAENLVGIRFTPVATTNTSET